MQAGSESIRPRPEKIPSGGKFELCGMFPNCRRGKKCTYAHSEAELMAWKQIRKRPHVVEPYGGAYDMCKNFPDCKKGEACTFAHSKEEKHVWSQQLKKELNIRDMPKVKPGCWKFTLCDSLTNCPNGDKCEYPHSEEEKHAWKKELAEDMPDMSKYVNLSEFATNPKQKGTKNKCYND